MTPTVPEAEAAVASFLQGSPCAQAVLVGFAARHGLSPEQAARLGCAFGGGMPPAGQLCGALSGALMVLGLALGGAAEDQEAQRRTGVAAQELWNRFQARHGSVSCRELLGVDIATPEGLKAAMRKGVFRSVCPAAVLDAAEIAAGLV